jgi:hypothetical protein
VESSYCIPSTLLILPQSLARLRSAAAPRDADSLPSHLGLRPTRGWPGLLYAFPSRPSRPCASPGDLTRLTRFGVPRPCGHAGAALKHLDPPCPRPHHCSPHCRPRFAPTAPRPARSTPRVRCRARPGWPCCRPCGSRRPSRGSAAPACGYAK